MIPSDLELHVGKINDWNNRILVAPNNSKIGEIKNINSKQNSKQNRKSTFKDSKNGEVEHHEKIFAKEHENDKQALVVGMTSVIICLLWYFK